MVWIYYYILLCLIIHQTSSGQNTGNKRNKRYLLFTRGTQWGVFVTISVPLHPETTTSVAWFFEANYYSVDNATYFEPLLGDVADIPRNRKKRDSEAPKEILTRKGLYVLIETMLEKYSYPGRPCLLRAICENATSHFLHNGILGDLIHLVLTPSTSISEEDLDDVFYEAEYFGLEHQCKYYNYDCPDSPLELISINAGSIL